MKVLFITNMYPVEDYIYFGIHVKEQIDDLKKKELEADIYFINGRDSKLNYVRSISDIKKKISTTRYDLIHVHYGISALFLLLFKPPVPVIITLHSGELYKKKGLVNHWMQKSLTLAILSKVKKIIVLNDDMIHLLKKHRQKLVKLPCGSNLEVFKEKKTQQLNQTFLIGFPGNKERKEKNYDLFFSIITELRKNYSIEIIEFHGLTRDQVVGQLNRLDLLLMTSTVEGSPQIIKEAMACNKPIVATNVGDVHDLLANVKNSCVINSFKAEEFIGTVEKILQTDHLERRSNGREKLLKMKLDSESVAERLYAVYNETV